MSDGREAARRPAPPRQRSRRLWSIAVCVTTCWVIVAIMTGSAMVATVLLVAVAALGAATVAGLRTMGVTRDHRWARWIASGPWRDVPDAEEHYLPDGPDAQVYRDVWSGPDSRYGHVAREWAYAEDADSAYGAEGPGHYDKEPDGAVTIMERTRVIIPSLRLVTGSSVAQTSISGARAGRGSVELVLPDEPTISRVHAQFTFSAGRWWITNQGMNGLCLNGAQVKDRQPLSGGDSIRWGTRPGALQSRVEIS